jgi:LCP family protein required for cell wall assembly
VTDEESDATRGFAPEFDRHRQSQATGSQRPPRARRSGSTRSPGKPKRRWARRTAFGVSLLLVIGMLLAATGWFYVNYRIGQISKVPVQGLHHIDKPGQPFNVLLVGSDSRSFCVTASCQSHLGDQGAAGGQRSDVIIILRLVPASKKLEMLSIPRDTFVPIAHSGGTENKINSAFNNGPNQLVATIEQDFHIPINQYAYANFVGFTDAVQALGGVYLDFPDRVKDLVTGLEVRKTGCQFVSGAESLQLVRSRDLQYYANGEWNYDGLGDLSRIRRQEAFFHAVIEKADSERNPLTINAFIGNAVHDIELDSTFTRSEILRLALEFKGMATSSLLTEVLPTIGAVYNGSDVLLPAWTDDNAMIKSFLAFGTTPAPAKSGSTSSTSSTSSTTSTTTTTTSLPVTGTTTPVIIDNPKYYPEPWNPYPC